MTDSLEVYCCPYGHWHARSKVGAIPVSRKVHHERARRAITKAVRSRQGSQSVRLSLTTEYSNYGWHTKEVEDNG